MVVLFVSPIWKSLHYCLWQCMGTIGTVFCWMTTFSLPVATWCFDYYYFIMFLNRMVLTTVISKSLCLLQSSLWWFIFVVYLNFLCVFSTLLLLSAYATWIMVPTFIWHRSNTRCPFWHNTGQGAQFLFQGHLDRRPESMGNHWGTAALCN